MGYQNKTKEQLIKEISTLNQQITKLKKSEDKNKQELKETKTLIDKLPQAVYEVDKKGNITFLNQTAFKTLGITKSDLKNGLPALQMLIPKDRKRVLDNIQKILNGKKLGVNEYTAIKKDGSTFPAVIHGSPKYKDGKTIGIRGIAFDVSKLKKTEKTLLKSQQEFSSLFESSPEALVYVDKNSKILDINAQFTKLFGYTLEEIKGKKTDSDLILSQKMIDEGKNLTKKALKGFVNYETIRKRKDGSEFPVFISSSPVKINNKLKGIITLYQDITERKQNEKVQQILYNISKAANSPISLGQLYKTIHQELGKIIVTTNFYIALVDKNKDELNFPYYIDEKDEKMPFVKFSITNTLTTYVIRTGKSLLINNAQYKEMINKGILTPMGSTTDETIWLGVPLKIEGRIMGAMAVQSYTNPNLFRKKDIKLMEFVSEQVATAIERKRMEEELKKFAHRDPLTGTYNRRYGLELLQRQVKLARRNKNSFLLAYTDLNNLKKINDEFGHEEGDKAIVQTANLFNPP